jgi:hypothetical protein
MTLLAPLVATWSHDAVIDERLAADRALVFIIHESGRGRPRSAPLGQNGYPTHWFLTFNRQWRLHLGGGSTQLAVCAGRCSDCRLGERRQLFG